MFDVAAITVRSCLLERMSRQGAVFSRPPFRQLSFYEVKLRLEPLRLLSGIVSVIDVSKYLVGHIECHSL